ncbi:MAG TPA: LdpA C-terminal domain-containing domain [Spirochaetota bacterium]|nr:LdpA C-terminal domain-containing domain [Spirochaetota bacterium]HOL57526.1 LdpA C-terminal domain-containing domain [Spirochaetota bacterium]HPP05253.1 LdpA C-terminal domain-containing domain [Spirochaetota bacterium]
MLIDILKNNKCFKLVCGAGNENVEEVERLVYLYCLAGANLFDLSANIDVIKAAKNSIKKAKEKRNIFVYTSVSFGISGDPHIRKATIDSNICKMCKRCINVCPQSAIFEIDNCIKIIDYKCIGCGKCQQVCSINAISFYQKIKPIREVLPEIVDLGIDCVELHSISDDENEFLKNWNQIISIHKGLVSLCLDRSHLGNFSLIKRIKNAIKNRLPYTTIIQADGAPMSGGRNDFKSTLQAVATAEIVANERLPVFILLSGGTNAKSSRLAKMCNISINGVAIGSYARQIVKKEIKRDDFFYNEKVFNRSLKRASNLVNEIFKYL